MRGKRVVVGFNETILQHFMNEVGDSFPVGVWIAIRLTLTGEVCGRRGM